jgi:hypothetical protein
MDHSRGGMIHCFSESQLNDEHGGDLAHAAVFLNWSNNLLTKVYGIGECHPAPANLGVFSTTPNIFGKPSIPSDRQLL